MKIKFVKDFNGIKAGKVVEIADHYGKELIGKKVAEQVKSGKKTEPEATEPEVNEEK